MTNTIHASPLIITALDPSAGSPKYSIGEVVQVRMRIDAILPSGAASAEAPPGSARCAIEHVAWFQGYKSWVYFLRRCVKETYDDEARLIALEEDLQLPFKPALFREGEKVWQRGKDAVALLPDKLKRNYYWKIAWVYYSQNYNDYEYDIDYINTVEAKPVAEEYFVEEGRLEKWRPLQHTCEKLCSNPHTDHQRLLVPNNESFLLSPLEVLVEKLEIEIPKQPR